jgi:hydroxyacylglutathione hydrolase
MVQITPEIQMLDRVSGGHVYMILDNGITLIDAGMGHSEKRILEEIKKSGYGPADIRQIIVTHAHPDHIGGLKALRDISGARVMASAVDADAVEGTKPVPIPKSSFAMAFLLRLIRPFLRHVPCPVDVRLRDKDVIPVLGGLVVVELPGHTPGNIGLYCPSKNVLFSGDTLRMKGDEFIEPLNYQGNETQSLASIKKMGSLDYEVMLSGHDQPILTGAAKKVAGFAEKLSH